MTAKQDASQTLPPHSVPLGLELNVPHSWLALMEIGYESQSQDEKWSVYFRRPWFQIWRPSDSGLYCYAVRFQSAERQRAQVAESWAASWILDADTGLGPDLERHREIIAWLLSGIASMQGGVDEELLGHAFENRLISGTRSRDGVQFSGNVSSLHDVDELAGYLREQISQISKDCR